MTKGRSRVGPFTIPKRFLRRDYFLLYNTTKIPFKYPLWLHFGVLCTRTNKQEAVVIWMEIIDLIKEEGVRLALYNRDRNSNYIANIMGVLLVFLSSFNYE